MSKKIIVTNECIGCGACFSSADFTKESPDGKAEVNGSGIIDGTEEKEFEKIMSECPVGALKTEDVIKKSKSDIERFIKDNIENFKFELPKRNDISYNGEANISIPYYTPGEDCYNYKSESAACSAGRNVVNSTVYSQRENIINSVMADFKVKTLRKYYVDEDVDGNYFYEAKKKAIKLLREATDYIKLINPLSDIPCDLFNIETQLKSSNIFLDTFRKNYFEENATNYVMREMQGEYYTLNYYTSYIDTGEMDTYEFKTGLFGGNKEIEITKYCYKKLSNIFKEIENDIKSACKSAKSEITDYTYGIVKSVLESYNNDLKKELCEKAQKLKELI